MASKRPEAGTAGNDANARSGGGGQADGPMARNCLRCGRPLSRYNCADYCGPCACTDDRPGPAHGRAITADPGLGARLRAARQRRGMTLDALAGLCGLSGPYLCMVEKGKRPLDRYSTIIALANALRIPPSELAPGLPGAPPENAGPVSGRGPARAADPAEPRLSPAIAGLCATVTSFGPGRHRSRSAQRDEIPALESLERQIEIAFHAYQQGRFTTAAGKASLLVADAELAARESGQPGRSRALEVLALSYQAAASVLTKAGVSDLALLAAERGLNAAEAADAPPVRASLIRCVAFTLHATGRFEPAMKLAESGAEYVNRQISGNDAALLSLLGTLFLVGAMAAARSGDGPRTAGYLAEASEAALRLGKDANHLWTAFGPTNVAIHRVNTAVELGDIHAVTGSGLSLDTRAVPRERRVRYLLDVARIHSMTGNKEDALATMLTAEQMAPQQVHQHYVGRHVVTMLTRSTTGKPAASLAGLARRMKISELS